MEPQYMPELPEEEHQDLSLKQAFSATPALVKVLVAVLAVQTIVVVAVSAMELFSLITGNVTHLGVAIALILCTLGLAWFMIALVRGVIFGRPWVRGPGITAEIFVLLVGVSFLQGSFWTQGISLVVLGAATIALFLTKPALTHIGMRQLPNA